MKVAILFVAVVGSSLFVAGTNADDVIPSNPPLRWWKGNIHTHTFWSDGDDFPEMVAEWYRTHDYNFLALSDHNILSDGVRWMNYNNILKRGGTAAMEKYLARFGAEWVETRGQPNSADYAVRLKPLSEFRALVEERGRFIMMPGEEITDSAEGKPVHLNATNIKELIRPLGGTTVREAIEANVRAVKDQAERTGQEIIVHLNHPNLGFAVTAEDLAAVVSERFFEVYNGHPGVKHLGDADHPSVERLWDIANTIRLGQLCVAPLYGVATDDSHNYHGKPGSHTGRGWIQVRSRHLTPESLIRAINRGDFYASSGVMLRDVTFDAGSGRLSLDIEPDCDTTFTTSFIGTPTNYDTTSEPRIDKDGKPIRSTRKYSSDVGKVFATVEGTTPSYTLTGDELYIRAVVTSSRPHRDPSFTGQQQQAWMQPVGWQAHLGSPTSSVSTTDE